MRGMLALACALATMGTTVGTAWAVPLLESMAEPGAESSEPGRLGTNLAAVTYYGGSVPFADLMRQAGDWVSNQHGRLWGEGPRLALRKDGWPARLRPGQFASTVVADVRYPAGQYAVTWTGSGAFTLAGKEFSGARGSGSIELDGTSMVVLDIRRTSEKDPLRGIRIQVPGTEPGDVFRPSYLIQLVPYGAVRFMDWQQTNSSPGDPPRRYDCATRIRATHYSQGTSMGASVEAMVDLANELDADPWFTIPHEASAGWIACHARVVATRLEEGLTPRYEFSNETWNPAFGAFHELTAQARKSGLGGGDDFLGLQILHARKHAAAMRVVGREMAIVDRPFVRVLAGQAANAWVLEQRVARAKSSTEEIAIAPYLGLPGANPFDSREAARIARWTPEQVLAALAEAQETEVDPWITDHLDLAAATGTTLVAYEGGQHLVGDPANDALTHLFVGVNRSPGMGQAYRVYLAHWRDLTGNALLMHFADVGPYTRYGSWGALEFPEQAGSPKYDELIRYAAGGTP